MPLNATNIVTGDIILATDVIQFYNLFTGVMTDQAVTLKSQVTIGGNHAANVVPLVVQGVSGQTANLFAVQQFSGSVAFGVSSTGSVTFGGAVTVSGGGVTITGASTFVSGGVTVQAGGLTVTAGGLTVAAGGATIGGLLTAQSGALLTGSVMVASSGSAFSQLEVSGTGATSWGGYASAGTNNPGTLSPTGGVFTINDSAGAAGDGGVLLFSAGSEWFAGIKAFFTNGANNGVGDLAFATRNAGTDTVLTERLRIQAGGTVLIGNQPANSGSAQVVWPSVLGAKASYFDSGGGNFFGGGINSSELFNCVPSGAVWSLRVNNGAGSQVFKVDTSGNVTANGVPFPLSNSSATLGSDTGVSANTDTDMVGLTLSAGTYLITAGVEFNTGTANTTHTAALVNISASTWISSAATQGNATNGFASLHLTGIHTISGSQTVNLRINAGSGTTVKSKDNHFNSAPATYINATRIA